MRRPDLLPILACLILCACGRAGAKDEADGGRPTLSLVGLWQTEAPVRYYGQDLRTTGEGRTEYRPDGRFRYTGRLTVQGEKLPPEGLSFRVDGEGRWQLENGVLSEDFAVVRTSPERAGETLGRLAGQLAREMEDAPPSMSRVDLKAGRLVLRDRDTGEEARYIRLR